jgi:hypothetical protein
MRICSQSATCLDKLYLKHRDGRSQFAAGNSLELRDGPGSFKDDHLCLVSQTALQELEEGPLPTRRTHARSLMDNLPSSSECKTQSETQVHRLVTVQVPPA